MVKKAVEGFSGIALDDGFKILNQAMEATTSLVAELKAVRMGLILAWDRGSTKLDLENDSSITHLLLNDLPYTAPRISPLIFYCRTLLDRKWEIK